MTRTIKQWDFGYTKWPGFATEGRLMRGCRLEFIVESREQRSGKTTRRFVKLPHANFQRRGTWNQTGLSNVFYLHSYNSAHPPSSPPPSLSCSGLLSFLIFMFLFRCLLVAFPFPNPLIRAWTNILLVYMNRCRTVLTVLCMHCHTQSVYVCVRQRLFLYV